MKFYLLLLPLLLLSCKNEPAKAPKANKPASTQTVKPPIAASTLSPWDFNGDGKADNDITINRIEGNGNPVEDGTPDSYTIIFNNKILPSLPIGCCEPQLVDEGDLNGDGAAELTVVQAPMNGCTHTLSTWSLKKGAWQQVYGPEMIPTGCDELSPEDLKNFIIHENGKVYFYKADFENEDFKKVKTEIHLK